MGSKQLLEYITDRVEGPIIIVVVDEYGVSSAPYVAENIHKALKENLKTSRKINLKHLNQESFPTKQCSI